MMVSLTIGRGVNIEEWNPILFIVTILEKTKPQKSRNRTPFAPYNAEQGPLHNPPMKTIYRYRKERYYAKPPEMIWPCVADTARINELSGSPPYTVEERVDAQGRVNRFATVGLGPLRIKWQEGFSEWEENRRMVQTRH